jgi:hypothetical protein
LHLGRWRGKGGGGAGRVRGAARSGSPGRRAVRARGGADSKDGGARTVLPRWRWRWRPWSRLAADFTPRLRLQLGSLQLHFNSDKAPTRRVLNRFQPISGLPNPALWRPDARASAGRARGGGRGRGSEPAGRGGGEEPRERGENERERMGGERERERRE